MDIVTAGLLITDEGIVCGVNVRVTVNYVKSFSHNRINIPSSRQASRKKT